MATTVSDSMIGQTITFRSKNVNDPNTIWTGILEAVTTNVIAQSYGDIQAYNSAVRQVDPTVPTDLTQETYLIITLSNSAGQQSTLPFSTSWIIDGSFAIVTPNQTVTVIVYNPPTNSQENILTSLRAAGYKCYIASVS